MRSYRITAVFILSFLLVIGISNRITAAVPDDGTYSVPVVLSGGTGRVSAQSPSALTVTGGQMSIKIVLSSSNYIYMKVDGIEYSNIASAGTDSTFIIPVPILDAAFTVRACTVAMSEPHEIEYQIIVSSPSVQVVQKPDAIEATTVAASVTTPSSVMNTSEITETTSRDSMKTENTVSTTEASSKFPSEVKEVEKTEDKGTEYVSEDEIDTEAMALQENTSTGKIYFIIPAAVLLVLAITGGMLWYTRSKK